jgi:hypothetical protein
MTDNDRHYVSSRVRGYYYHPVFTWGYPSIWLAG